MHAYAGVVTFSLSRCGGRFGALFVLAGCVQVAVLCCVALPGMLCMSVAALDDLLSSTHCRLLEELYPLLCGPCGSSLFPHLFSLTPHLHLVPAEQYPTKCRHSLPCDLAGGAEAALRTCMHAPLMSHSTCSTVCGSHMLHMLSVSCMLAQTFLLVHAKVCD